MKRRKNQKGDDEVRMVLGVCWYTPEEFIKMKQAASDREVFEDTYEEWRQFAEKTMADLKKQGADPRRVFVKTDDFRRWCDKNGLPTDGSARTRYVAEILRAENNPKITSR
jgi:hypothetical protein